MTLGHRSPFSPDKVYIKDLKDKKINQSISLKILRTSTLYVGTRCAGVRKIYIGDKAAEKRIREIYIRELGVLMKSWRGKVEGEIVLLKTSLLL